MTPTRGAALVCLALAIAIAPEFVLPVHLTARQGGGQAPAPPAEPTTPLIQGDLPALIGADAIPDLLIGQGAGGGMVRLLSGVDYSELGSGFPFGGFIGGVRVAAGDVNGDGVADVIVGQGHGGAQVRVFNGTNAAVIASFDAFSNFANGVYVAAGDVNNDGYADVVVGSGTGGLVRVFSGLDRREIGAGYPFGPSFPGGVTVGLADVNADGQLDYITGTALGGLVAVFDGRTTAPLGAGFPYGPFYFGGISVAGADVTGDGRAEVITGPLYAPIPDVRVFNLATGTMVTSYLAHPDAAGVTVAAGDVNGDGFADVITGAGVGAPSRIRIFDGVTRQQLLDRLAFPPAFTGGVFVATTAGASTLRFTSANATTFTAGSANTFTITTTGAANPPIALVSGTLPAGVTLTDHGNGTATLAGNPPASAAGTRTLTFRAGLGVVPTQVFTLTVDDVPVAANDAYAVNEAATLTVPAPGVIANDTNVVGTPLTASLVSAPTQASAFTFHADGSFTYTHNGSESPLTDTFTYRINDTRLDSNVATVTITIAPQPDAPVANNDAYSVAEGGTLAPAPAAGVLANDTDVDSATLTAVLVAAPTRAFAFTLNANGSFTYTHNGSETTTDSFTYRASDGTLTSNIATVVITISPVNDAPVANADAVTVNEGATVTQAAPGLLANDTDAEGSPLTAVLVTGPAHASAFTLNANGSYAYTHNGSEGPLTDTFTYRANDGLLDSNIATVTITIVPVNDAPVAVNDSFSVAEGGTLTIALPGVLVNDTDADSASLTAVLGTGPAQAAAFTLNANGSFTYTHNGSETTTDSFTYRASDGAVTSNLATVTITVTPVNDAPIALADSYNVNEGGTLTTPAPGVLANDADPEGTAVAVDTATVTLPANGTLILNADGSFTYTHNGSETTADAFTYRVTDGTAFSLPATVTIAITAVNDAPVIDLDADNSGGTTGADYAVTFTENAPATLLEDAADATITDVDSTTLATLTVTLTNLLDAGQETLDVDLTGFPAFGKNYDTTTTAGQGILTIFGTGGPEPIAAFQDLLRRVTYRHTGDNPDATARVVTFSAFDATTASNTATSTVTIVPVNDPPTAVDDNFAVAEGDSLSVTSPGVRANDTDPDTPTGGLTAVLVTGPAQAAAFALNPDGSFNYLHNGADLGSDSFTYRLNDGSLDSNIATVTIAIGNVNDPPTAMPDSYTVAEGGTVTTPAPGVLANDLDPDSSLVAALLVGPTHATSFTLNPDGSFAYTHNGSETSTDSFTYAASDGIGPPSPATVTITITPVNDVPALDLDADDSSGATGTGYQFTFTEADPATFAADPADATITDVDSPTLSSITVTLTNLLDPTFELIDVDLVTGGFNANFTKNYDTTTDPTKGVLTINATTPQPLADFLTLLRRVTYENNDFDPDATPRIIEFVVNDGAGASNTATTTVAIVPVANTPPVANDDTGTTNEDATLTVPAPGVLANDTDPGDTFTIVAVTGGTVGAPFTTAKGATLTLNADGSYVYNPIGSATLQALRAGQSDTDTVTYTIQDTQTAQDSATLTITVTGVNDAPAGTDTTVTTNEDAAYTFAPADFGFTDPVDQPDDAFFAVRIATLPAVGSLTLSSVAVVVGQFIPVANIGNLVFTPVANGSGTPYATFTFQVQDNGGTANGGVDLDPSANTLSINVTSVNDAPAGTNNTVSMLEDATRAFTAADFGFTDPNDTPANTLQSVVITTLPAAGTLTLSGAGFAAGTEIPVASITAGLLAFTPAANAGGTPYAAFTFQVRDNGGTANGGVDLDPSANTFTFDVTPVNDAPSGTNTTVTTDEDVQYLFTVANFGFTDPNDTPPNTLQSVVITTLPAVGSLTLSGAGFAAGTEIPVASITAGNLRYLSPLNAFGSPFTTFTFQVRDNGGTANGGVDLDPSANTMTVNVNPVNDAPAVVNETFEVLGNTELRVDMTTGTTPHTSETTTGVTAVEGVLDNDSDPEGDPFAVTGILNCTVPDTTAPFDCTLTGGAVVHVDANGEFSYTPPPGATSGSFTYTVTDQPAAGAPASVNGTVTFTFFDMIWYVDADAAAGGTGTSSSPFNTFASLSGAGGAGDSDDVGHYIFVHAAAAAITTGIELELNQHLIGEAAGLSINRNLNGNGTPTTLVPPGPRPVIAAAGNAVAITNAVPIEVIGLALSGTLNAIDMTSAGALPANATLGIVDNVINGAGQEGIDINLNAGTTGTLGLIITSNTWNTGGTHTGNAVDINRAAGTLNLSFSNNSVIKSNATAVVVNGGAVANTNITNFFNNSVHASTVGAGVTIQNVTFDADPATGGAQQVNAGPLTVGVSGDPVGAAGVTLTTVQGNLSFTDLDVFAATSALTATGTGTGITLGVSPAVSTLVAQAGAAVDITLAAINLQVAGLTSATSGSGVSLTTVSGTFSAPAGSTITKTGGTGAAFSVNNSAAGTTVLTSTYGGTINNSSGTGGAVAITIADAGSTLNFTGAITDNPGTGIALTSNTGATMSFSGGMTLNGANSRVAATGGGTLNITGTNSIGATTVPTGPAVNISSTTIGGSGVTFQRVSATGGTNGIVLNATGNGAFTVNGDGTLARNGSGGTINNATGDGIQLTNANNVTLRSMNLVSNGTNPALAADAAGITGSHTIEANGGSNVVLSGLLIDATDGTGLLMLNLSGTNRVNSNTRFQNIALGAGHAIYVNNTDTNNTLLEFDDIEMVNNASNHTNFFVANTGSSNMTVAVQNSLFEDLGTQALTMAGGGVATTTGILTSTVFNNDFQNAKGLAENNLGVLVNNGATHASTVQGNLFDNIAKDGTIANTSILRTQNNGGTLNATVTGNTIQNISYAAGNGGRHVIGHVYEPPAVGAGASNLVITNNTISNVTYPGLAGNNREAIFVDYRVNANGGEVTIQGNNFNMPTAGAQQAIELRFRQTNPNTVPVLVRGNTIVFNTAVAFLDVDAEDGANVQLTVDGSNNFTNSNGTPGQTIALATEDPVAAGGPPSMCANVTGNTLQTGAGTIELNETAGTMTATQASAAAMAAANGIPGGNVTVLGTPTFGVAACTLP